MNANSWLITQWDYGKEYSFSADSMAVVNSSGEAVYHVPNAEALQGYQKMATDGKYVYLCNDTELLKVELLTGEILGTVQTGRILVQNIVDSFVLYYAEHDGGHFNLCRVYLPEMKQDVLGSFDAPAKVYGDDNTSARSSGGSIRWVIRAPEMMDLLEKELKNPESAYQKPIFNGNEVDFSYLWQARPALL